MVHFFFIWTTFSSHVNVIRILGAFNLNIRFQTTQGSCFRTLHSHISEFWTNTWNPKFSISSLICQNLELHLMKLGIQGKWLPKSACIKDCPKLTIQGNKKVPTLLQLQRFAVSILFHSTTVIWDFLIQPVHLPYFFTQRGQIHWVCGQYHSHIQTEWANFQSTQCSGVKHWTEVLFCNQLHCISIFFATGG